MGPKKASALEKPRLSKSKQPEVDNEDDVLAISEKDLFLPEEEEDAGEQPNELNVPIFEVFINRPAQWASFLDCPEKAVKLKCIDQMYEALRSVPGLAKKLIVQGVIEKTMELAYYPQTLIKAHCFRLLAEIFKAKYQLSIDSYKLKKLVFHALAVLKRSRVFVLLEFSSKLLAMVTHIPKIRAFIVLECRDLNYLFWRIDTKDPDVQNNTLQLLHNLIRDKYCGQVIVNQECFFFTHFFELMKSEYVQAQETAVDIVCHLIKRNIPELNELFHKELGLVHMFEFLEIFSWRDLHSKIFTIVQNASKENIILQSYLEHPEWIEQIIDYIEFIENDKLIRQDLLLIIQLLRCSLEIKTIMMNLGLTSIVKRLFVKDNPIYIKSLAIEIMCVIATSQDDMRIILENNTMNRLFKIIIKYNCTGTLAEISIFFINKLTATNYTLMDYDYIHLELLKAWFQRESDLSDSFLSNLLNIFSVLVEDEYFKDFLKTEEFLIMICKILKVNSQLDHILKKRLTAANILYALSQEDTFIWDFFYRYHFGVEDFMDMLKKSSNIKIIASLSKLIELLIRPSETLALRFIRQGCLIWFIQNEKVWFPNEDVESLLHLFYKKFLPIKFNYMGHLEFTDLTKSGFYCLKGAPHKNLSFPMLKEMKEYDCSRINLAYVFAYKNKPYNKELRTKPKKDSDEEYIFEDVYSKISEGIKKCNSVERNLGESDDLLVDDEAVSRMVETIKTSISTNENYDILSKTWTKIRVKILTNIIINSMGKQMPIKGYEDDQDYHNLHLHITELKIELKSNIIPLGALRIGFKFERALLFKCLADIIGLPCRLVRGERGIAWNEVCITKRDEPHCDLPLSRMVPSHVVDLWKKPGKLLPVGRLECDQYCGPRAQPLHSMRALSLDIFQAVQPNKYR